MTIKRYFLSLFLLVSVVASAVAGGIGTWKNYLSYSNIQWVEQGGNKLYVLASNSLYSYNRNDQSIRTYDKINGLSGMDIKFIGWNQTAKRLVIVYSDYNIDLLDDRGNVTNVPDYYLKTLAVDKTVNGIDMSGAYCYLSTGFGLVKLNVSKAEITDSYNLAFPVNYSYIESNYIYAASENNGLYRALLTANLLDRSNWTQVGNYVARSHTMDADLLAQAKRLSPGGPKRNTFIWTDFRNNRLYTTGGYYDPIADNWENPGIVQVLQGDDWDFFEDDFSARTGYAYLGTKAVAVDPRNSNHVFVGARTGLYEFLSGKMVAFYNKDNSILQSAMDDGRELGNDYVLVNGLAYDREGNLWVLNNQTKKENLIRMSKDGQMTSFSKAELMKDGVGLSGLSQMRLDSRNLLWFCNDHWIQPGLFSYDPKNDKLNAYTRFINDDGSNVDITAVHCWAEDLDNNIWIGTTAGPLLLQRSQMNKQDSYRFVQVKVPRNDGTNLADYLLAGLEITAMAVDGGGRKWFGTKGNGVYLISADNMMQLKHFITTNSNLLSNNIQSISINHATGEVFFATDKGLCSYMSDATKAVDSPDDNSTYAYPNPVKPGYTGPVTIVGLSLNADVKIVTTNGVLVAEGTSNGGTFVWDGKDKNGKRVASGVYMVQSADENGDNGTVCKVAVVN
ncbi:MAG: type IX secretion system anionic LPS delivery protein PorZ [Prevotella fusca]|uniref:type IX secretion system anionic LPS delivery protein PorZ n=1 Tax=Prevotella fusca TaxID=589436 RepID=UPI003FA031C8